MKDCIDDYINYLLLEKGLSLNTKEKAMEPIPNMIEKARLIPLYQSLSVLPGALLCLTK